MERRFVNKATAPISVEARADGGKKIVGYGAVFYSSTDPGTEYELWDGCSERIMPGAFDRALSERHDARGLYNHDPSALLGRVSSSTMRLSVDAKGLRYEIDLPDTQVGRDVAVSIERGDLTGSSFAFVATRSVWIDEQTPDGEDLMIRQIEDMDLYDTGPVTYPAYEATTTGLRSTDGVRQEYEAWKAARVSASDEVSVRSRILQIDLDDMGDKS